MHGTLLGVTKTLMCLWFSSTRSGKPFFIGKKLKEISKSLCEIRPLDHIQRLPRNIETYYSSLKASEYEAWLLYYCIPCVVGILPHVYLDHFSLLSEAIYLLLGDSITTADIDRAQSLLLSFYKDFEDLYGQGSCGLNVHNIGIHLVNCVKMWGPLWAWSCFSFEDCNNMLIKSAHGTGNVSKQIIRSRAAQIHVRRESQIITTGGKEWSNLKEPKECQIAGAFKLYKSDTGEQVDHLRTVGRVIINSKQRICSKQYSRLKKRISYFIALIHPIQWTIAYPVGADRPAKHQKKTSCVSTG